jgi:hypothetical protein
MADSTFTGTSTTSPSQDYATLAEVKAQLGEPEVATSTDYDVMLTAQITAVSRLIDREVGKWAGFFYPTTDATAYYYDGNGTKELWIDEFASITTLKVSEEGGLSSSDYSTWSSSDYVTFPYNDTPIIRLDVDTLNGSKLYWYPYRKAVEVTGIRGYSTTPPDDVNQACIIQAARWFMRAKQAWADTGASPDFGQITVNVGGQNAIGSKLDPDVAAILWHYKSPVGIP